MQFTLPLFEGRLIKRHKRFLADILTKENQEITIFCPNTGSMRGCLEKDAPIWYSAAANTQRTYPHTWEIIRINRHLIGINTHTANNLALEAIERKIIPTLANYSTIKREVKYGTQNSRIDFLLSQEDEFCYVEVKNVTLCEDNIGYFPDAVTSRGTKHLQELIHMKKLGHRAVLFFCVQHTGVTAVKAAVAIDPLYSQTLRQAVDAGVEIICYRANISPTEIVLQTPIPFEHERMCS